MYNVHVRTERVHVYVYGRTAPRRDARITPHCRWRVPRARAHTPESRPLKITLQRLPAVPPRTARSNWRRILTCLRETWRGTWSWTSGKRKEEMFYTNFIETTARYIHIYMKCIPIYFIYMSYIQVRSRTLFENLLPWNGILFLIVFLGRFYNKILYAAGIENLLDLITFFHLSGWNSLLVACDELAAFFKLAVMRESSLKLWHKKYI